MLSKTKGTQLIENRLTFQIFYLQKHAIFPNKNMSVCHSFRKSNRRFYNPLIMSSPGKLFRAPGPSALDSRVHLALMKDKITVNLHSNIYTVTSHQNCLVIRQFREGVSKGW